MIVIGLKDVFVCGHRRGVTRDERENIGLNLIKEHWTWKGPDGKAGLCSECAGGDQESSAEACPGMMSAGIVRTAVPLTGYSAIVVARLYESPQGDMTLFADQQVFSKRRDHECSLGSC